MGRVHTRIKPLGYLASDDYTDAPPRGAQRKLGPLFLKRGLRDKIYFWRDEWFLCDWITDDQFEKAENPHDRIFKKRKGRNY